MMSASTYREWAAESRALARSLLRKGRIDLAGIAFASARYWEVRALVRDTFTS